MRKDIRPDTTKLDKRVNPFSYSLEIKLKQLENINTFVLEEGALVHQTYTVEATPKVSLYIKSEHRLVQNNLYTCAKELLLWILYTLETNTDYIWINKIRYMKETSTTINTYKKAIDSLERYGFLSSTSVKDTYWINPEFFFRGDRKNKYPDKCSLEIVKTN